MNATPVTSFDLDRKLSVAGKAADLFGALSEKLWDQNYLPTPLLELCRLDLAQLHRADAELAARRPNSGLNETKIRCVVEARWHKDPQFSAAEKAALNFTEYYFLDPESISDECAAAVVSHFGESGLVFLVEALGFIDSRIRLALVYNALGSA